MTANECTHLVRASERRRETTQTPGMARESAGRTTRLWAGIANTAGHASPGLPPPRAHQPVTFVPE